MFRLLEDYLTIIMMIIKVGTFFCLLQVADQEQQLKTDDVGTKEVDGKNATRDTFTMDHTSSTKEPQQNAQGEHNISGSVSNKKENQTAQVSEYL